MLLTPMQISRYNNIDLSVSGNPHRGDNRSLTLIQEDVQEDWGWKLVHGEVFRKPSNPLILSDTF